jgi:Uma2 family endonuclease
MSPPSRAHALLAPGASTSSGVSAHLPGHDQALLPVDERLVAPETPFEIVDGRVIEVMGSHEPHAAATGQLAYVLGALVRPTFRCAVDMLTRADRFSDVAPDASVFPVERDPETGRRQLEHWVFEVCDTQALAGVTRKAQLLSERGVRRVFCIEVDEPRVLEWTRGDWQPLGQDEAIDDPLCLVSPLPVSALLSAAGADNAAAAALLAKNNAVLLHALDQREQRGRLDGRADGLRNGRADGLRDGRADGLRDGIADLCELLGISLGVSQRKQIAALDLDGLEQLRARLKIHKRWPLRCQARLLHPRRSVERAGRAASLAKGCQFVAGGHCRPRGAWGEPGASLTSSAGSGSAFHASGCVSGAWPWLGARAS